MAKFEIKFNFFRVKFFLLGIVGLFFLLGVFKELLRVLVRALALSCFVLFLIGANVRNVSAYTYADVVSYSTSTDITTSCCELAGCAAIKISCTADIRARADGGFDIYSDYYLYPPNDYTEKKAIIPTCTGTYTVTQTAGINVAGCDDSPVRDNPVAYGSVVCRAGTVYNTALSCNGVWVSVGTGVVLPPYAKPAYWFNQSNCTMGTWSLTPAQGCIPYHIYTYKRSFIGPPEPACPTLETCKSVCLDGQYGFTSDGEICYQLETNGCSCAPLNSEFKKASFYPAHTLSQQARPVYVCEYSRVTGCDALVSHGSGSVIDRQGSVGSLYTHYRFTRYGK